MNQKDTELIRALGELLKKFKKIFHLGSFFHHGAVDDHNPAKDASQYADKNVDIEKVENVNDATGENAIHSALKKENLTKRDN